MPSERALREAFGVGRTTVREALNGLIASSFVERRNNQLVVCDPALLPEHEVDIASLAARLSVADVFETRKRSEEHTSELQSPCNLVCRLLLVTKHLGFEPGDFRSEEHTS